MKCFVSSCILSEDANMGQIFRTFLDLDEVEDGGSADHDILKQLEARFGVELHEDLLDWWLSSDGGKLPGSHADMVGSVEVLEGLESSRIAKSWQKFQREQGAVPIFYDRESNYLMFCLKPPLAPHVLWVPHDDGPRLMFRNLESCVTALTEPVRSGGNLSSFLHETHGDYPPSGPRPVEDQEAARQLLETDGENNEWNYAIQLLDATNLPEWERVLNTNHFIRRDARDRMDAMMDDPGIREVRERDQAAFQDFANAVRSHLSGQGMEVGELREGTLNVVGKWFLLESFFFRRDIPNAMDRLAKWIEDVLNRRKPRDRPGHFHDDSAVE
ncbi:MAG: SMI1/KNR4 family protein [Verrucomicrobiota bacterium]